VAGAGVEIGFGVYGGAGTKGGSKCTGGVSDEAGRDPRSVGAHAGVSATRPGWPWSPDD